MDVFHDKTEEEYGPAVYTENMKSADSDSRPASAGKNHLQFFSGREIPDSCREPWLEERWRHNRRYLRISSLLSLVAGILLTVRRLLLFRSGTADRFNNQYLLVYIVLVAVTLSYILVSYLLKREDYRRRFEVGLRLLILFYLLIFMAVNYLDMQRSANYSALITVILFIGAVFWLDLATFIAYMLSVALITFLSYRAGVHLSVVGGELAMEVVLFVMMGSAMFYSLNQMRVRSFLAERQLEASIEELKDLSLRDHLTRLFNRRMMNDELDRETAFSRRTGKPLTIIIIDIDHFKRVNDSLGHSVGDDVLKQCAVRLNESVRVSDRVYRFGGEEFLVLLPDSDIPGAKAVADRLLHCFPDTPFEGVPWPITISMGIADNTERLIPADLIKLADCRMYMSKKNGRNRYTSEGCTVEAGEEPVIP